MSETSVSAEMMPKIPEKLVYRRRKIAYNILKNTKCKFNDGRLICGEYEVLIYIFNSAWIEVTLEKKENEILRIKDIGNIAKIIKHIRIAIS